MTHRYTLLLLPLLLALLPPSARAQSYVTYFEIPGNPSMHGLDYHDGYLWAAVRSSTEPRILQIDPESGELVASIDLPGFSGSPLGVAWDGEAFWLSRNFTSAPRLYRYSTEGELLADIPAPSQLSNGLAFHDGLLWVAKAYPDPEASLVAVDPTDGTELEVLPFPETQPGGIAFLGDGTLWATNVGDDGTNIEVLLKLERATGEVLDELAIPEGSGRPRGLAYDGSQFLYGVMNKPGASTAVIYKIDLGASGNPSYSASASEIDFGLCDLTLPHADALTVFNEGTAPLEVTHLALAGDDAFLLPDADDFTVEPGGQHEVEIVCSPSEYGPFSGALTFETNDVAHAEVSIPLRAVGIHPVPTVGFVAGAHDFGEVRIEDPFSKSVARWPLQIINQGLGALEVASVSVEGEGFELLTEGFPLSITTADTAVVVLAFRPEAVGAYEGTATVASNEPGRPEATVALSGTGIDPEIEGGSILWSFTVPDNPATSFQDKKVPVIRSMGDVTGDGVADLVLAAANYYTIALDGNGWGTADTLWTFNSCPHNFNCGSVGDLFPNGLAAGFDLNGDGLGDVVLATGGGNNHVYALDGATGEVIWAVGDEDDPYLGSYEAVSVRFDLTGDGIPEVAASTGSASANSPNPYNHRRVYLLDGATGEELWQAFTDVPNFAVQQLEDATGRVLVAAGGRADNAPPRLVAYDATNGVEAWSISPPSTPFLMAPFPLEEGEDLLYGGFNAVARFDGATGETVWSNAALGPSVWEIALVGDVNGDGVPEVAVGSSSNRAELLDGATGERIWAYQAGAQVFSVAAAGDLTGDGVPNVALALGDGRVVLLDGADGSEVWGQVLGDGTIEQAAEFITAVPDVDGSGGVELAAGTRHGRVALLAGTGEPIVATEDGAAPASFALEGSFPNPFSEQATIRFRLAEAGPVRLVVYDLLGRRVRVLVDGELPEGAHEVGWDGCDGRGLPAASGLFLYRLEAGRASASGRMTLLR